MLNILTYGGSGNINLYATNGAEPSPGDADARSERRGNSETIRIARPAAGTYYIKVLGVTAFDRVTLQARHLRGTSPPRAGEQLAHRTPPRHHRPTVGKAAG